MKRVKRLTTEPVRAGDFTGMAKEFGRDKDVHAIYSHKRGTLYNLHAKGKIRGVLLRIQGHKSGVRLWDMASIRDSIRSQMDATRQGEAK